MAFTARCDTCALDMAVDTERQAYHIALEHEREHGDHFVFINEIQ